MRQIVELKSLLTSEPIKAIELFDRLVGQDADTITQEACGTLANYIRHSSVFKRRLLFTELQKCSFFAKLCISFQFHSFEDTVFPRKLIFERFSVFCGELEKDKPHHRHHVTAVGSNRFFNLGLLSDGSPVSEPRLVPVPRVIQIEMTNTHTIFLTAENQIYGCGKASSFLPDKTEETDGGYVALPTLVEIPKVTGYVAAVKVFDGGSQFLIGGKWYCVGKCSISGETRRISSNCFVLVEEENEEKLEKMTKNIDFYVANVPIEERIVKVYLKMDQNEILWDRTSDFSAEKPISFIINGFPQMAIFESFQLLNDGTIYAARNSLFKGKLELWKNKDDGFKVKSGTVLEHFDTKYTLIALMEEVPGTIGTEFFKVSPDGQNLIMKMGYQNEQKTEKFEFESPKIHKIIKNREVQCDPVDIPLDSTIHFHQNYNQEVLKFQSNRLLFQWIYPNYLFQNDGDVHFSIEQLETVFAVDLENLEFPKYQPISPEEFVPTDTSPSDIWYLKSSEKLKIPCHKYLLLLHSRQIGAMQRFHSNYGNFGDFKDGKSENEVEIEANASVETVKNALRGMINIRTLFKIKTIELIECINFYDYHLMDEMFNDSMHILMETITEFTLPFLYELFYSFEEKVLEGLLQRKYLISNSISSVLPPKELLVRFAEKLDTDCRRHHTLKVPSKFKNLENLSTYEPEYIVKYFLNLDQDSEDVTWRSIRHEFHDTLDTWHAEAVKKRDERRMHGATRSRTSSIRKESFTKIQNVSMTSSPIPIGGGRSKPESFSKSINSPVIQSPLSPSPIKGMPKSRHDSISNSLDDFPEMSISPSPSTPKSSSGGGRFAPKGTRFKKDFEILVKPSQSPQNPWKMGGASASIREEIDPQEIRFDEVVKKEQKLQTNIRTGFKKVQLLPHVETEELAGAQILEVFRRELHDEALICVELVMSDDLEVENEQIIWGNMPGLVRR